MSCNIEFLREIKIFIKINLANIYIYVYRNLDFKNDKNMIYKNTRWCRKIIKESLDSRNKNGNGIESRNPKNMIKINENPERLALIE